MARISKISNRSFIDQSTRSFLSQRQSELRVAPFSTTSSMRRAQRGSSDTTSRIQSWTKQEECKKTKSLKKRYFHQKWSGSSFEGFYKFLHSFIRFMSGAVAFQWPALPAVHNPSMLIRAPQTERLHVDMHVCVKPYERIQTLILKRMLFLTKTDSRHNILAFSIPNPDSRPNFMCIFKFWGL